MLNKSTVLAVIARQQNLTTCSFYHPGPLHKISLQSIYNFFSNVANKQVDRKTNRKTDKQTIGT